MKKEWLLFLSLLAVTVPAISQTIPVAENLSRLIRQEDTDGDKKITVHDHVTPFKITGTNGATASTVRDTFPESILLQELKRASDTRHDTVLLETINFDESPASRTHRMIQTYYWDALTRRIDATNIDKVVHDPKVLAKDDTLYVPATDTNAIRYFKSIEQAAAASNRFPALKVVVLPPVEKINGDFVRNLDGQHGLLTLKLETNADGSVSGGTPYVVPGGRFNELYYWDSYFIVLGLLQDGRKDLARGTADNLIYEMEYYGKIPNANRTYYLTRSQPPFLTSIIRAVHDAGAADKPWLRHALEVAVNEYRTFWMGEDRLVSVGPYKLNRYYDSGDGPCPEVEPGHYDEKISPWLDQANATVIGLPVTPYRLMNEFMYCGKYSDITVNGIGLVAFFKHDRAQRESGHDTTHRFDDRTSDFVPVDLNALLYRYEMDFAELLDSEFGGNLASLGGSMGTSTYWRQQAQTRKQAMMATMWDNARGFFFDYDYVSNKRSDYITATGLYPLWAKLIDINDSTERPRADRVVAYMRAKLEEPAGLAASAQESVAAARTRDVRQWDFPYGWPPHQMLAWRGLKNYGFDGDANRLAYHWLYAVAKNVRDYNGTIPEKMNVVTGSHEVFAEYGNVGTKFDYITPEGFGWMNASFEVGMNFISTNNAINLELMLPPQH